MTFILRRVLYTLPALWVMTVIVFLIIRLVPGDPARTMLGFRATEENIAVVRSQWGLDRPLVVQYFDWIVGILSGDLGTDFVSQAPLTELLAQRIPVTLQLTLMAIVLAVGIGVPLGVRAATGGRWVKRLTNGFVIGGVSIPDFWFGIMLILIFAGTLGILPPSGYIPFLEDPLQNLRYMALPVLALGAAQAAYFLKTTRSAVEAVMDRPFVTFLRAKGLSERRITTGHALRNAAPTVVTVIGIQVGALLGGAVVIEVLFALPGLGRLIVTAINQRNYPTVQVGVLVIAAAFIVISLLMDITIGWLDPRVADGVSQ